MNGERILDTNAMIAFMLGNVELREQVAGSSRLLLLTVVLGELYYGACKSSLVDRNLANIESLLDRSTLISSDATTAAIYGQIKNELRVKGRPIPDNDIWLAAVARQSGFTIVSRDKHFSHVDGISVEDW